MYNVCMETDTTQQPPCTAANSPNNRHEPSVASNSASHAATDAPVDENYLMLASLRILLNNGHPLPEAVRLTNEHFRMLDRVRRRTEQLEASGLSDVVTAINDDFRKVSR
jgi:hypothetical protein